MTYLRKFAVYAALALTGCTGTDIFLGQPLAISYQGQEAEMRTRLLTHLRQRYLVSEAADRFIVDTPVYQGESKGFLGLGPRWQEKITYVVRIFGDSVVRKMEVGRPELSKLFRESRSRSKYGNARTRPSSGGKKKGHRFEMKKHESSFWTSRTLSLIESRRHNELNKRERSRGPRPYSRFGCIRGPRCFGVVTSAGRRAEHSKLRDDA